MELKFQTINRMVEDLTSMYMLDKGIATDYHFYRSYTKPMILYVEQPTAEVNFKYVAMDHTRWKKFCRSYLGSGFFEWLRKAPNITASAEYGCSFSTKSKHKLGNCIVGISVRIAPEPTITLMSRASYIVPTAFLELALVGMIADRFKQYWGPMKFVWMSAQMQFSAIYGFPYIQSYWLPRHLSEFQEHILNEDREPLSPTVKKYLKYLENYNSGEGKKMSYQRVARVYHKTEALLDGQYEDYTPSEFYNHQEDSWV